MPVGECPHGRRRRRVAAVTDPAGGVPDPDLRCPWCSATINAGAPTCPSCGAALTVPAAEDTAIPGVTSLDPGVTGRRPPPRPNRLVSWLAGDLDPLPGPDPTLPLRPAAAGAAAPVGAAGPESFAPPSAEVRREMARLELEAIQAELQANAPEAEPPSSPPSPRSPDEGDASA